MKNKLLKIVLAMGSLVISCLFIYGCYWIAKTVSYSIFYEDMVKQTIIEMVEPESLKRIE